MTDSKITTGGRPNGKWASPEVKQRFLELIHEGVSIRGASRLVGINRRTGQEWVNGRNERIGTTMPGRKAVRPAVQPLAGTRRESLPHPRRDEWVGRRRRISDRYLSEEERIRIADLRRGEAVRPVDRGRTGPQPVDHQSGDPAQLQSQRQAEPHRLLPPLHRSETRRGTPGAPQVPADRPAP
jgi:hypothetical protein